LSISLAPFVKTKRILHASPQACPPAAKGRRIATPVCAPVRNDRTSFCGGTAQQIHFTREYFPISGKSYRAAKKTPQKKFLRPFNSCSFLPKRENRGKTPLTLAPKSAKV
jgi:hypothetical protein